MAVKSTPRSNFFHCIDDGTLMMIRNRASARGVLSCDVSVAGVYSDMAAGGAAAKLTKGWTPWRRQM